MENIQDQNENQVPPTNTGEATSAPKVRKTRIVHPKVNKAADPVLVLDRPTTVAGAVDSTLVPTMMRKYTEIALYEPDGKKVKAVLKAKEPGAKVDNIGTAMLNMVLAIANAAMAGQGSGPDGSALWVMKNLGAVLKFSPNFSKYQLRLEGEGRAGVDAYQAPISTYLKAVQGRAEIVSESLKHSKPAKPLVRAAKDAPAKVTVKL